MVRKRESIHVRHSQLILDMNCLYDFAMPTRLLLEKVRAALSPLFFLLAMVSPMFAATADGEPQRTILVAVDNAYAPYSFQTADGKLQGILVDQWRAWEKKTGIKVELHALDWGDALRRTRAGEFDVIDSIVETTERRDYFDFTPAHTPVEASIFFRRDIAGIADLASLKGFPVGVKAGDQHIDKLRENGVTTVVPFQSNDEIVNAAKQRKINVFVVDVPAALYLLNKMGIDADFHHTAPIFRDELRRAVRKGDTALLRIVSDGFAAIEPAELKAIDEKWFGHTINRYGAYLTYASYAAAFATLLIAGLAGWNRLLRTKVLERTAALRESEQRYLALFENMAEGVVYLRILFENDRPQDAVYLAVNPAWKNLSGLSDVVGRRVSELTPGMRDTNADFFERAGRVARSGHPERFETYSISLKRWFSISAYCPQREHVIVVLDDITDRRHVEDRLRLVIDTIPTMVWSLQADGAVDFVNQRWLDYTGLSFEDALVNANRIVHPEDLPTVIEKWLVDKPAGASSEYEMRLRGADGKYRWFLVRTVPLKDQQGNVVKWYGTSTDIEDRKLADEALRQSEFELEEAQRIARIGSWTLDSDTDIVRGSAELFRVFGIERTAFGNGLETFFQLIHPDDLSRVTRMVEKAGLSGKPYEIEYRITTPGGQQKDIRAVGYARMDSAGIVSGQFGIAQDITEQKRAENALRDSGVQLQALSRRLVELQESERKELARELHDRVGQSLTALTINFAILQQTLSSESGPIRSRLDDSAILLRSTMQAIENVLSDLRPPMLDDHGLHAALDWYAMQFSTRAGIAVSVKAGEPDERMTADVEIALFRIAQEALNNVAKHAHASSVVIELDCHVSEYVMSVADDGVGLRDSDEPDRPRRGLGMVTMRERAQAVGGSFQFETPPDGGTRLTVRIPK